MTGPNMETDATRGAMNGVAAAGSDFGSAWAAAQGGIGGLAGGLGKGPMGEAFMKGYRPAADQLSTDATKISAGLKSAAAAGTGAVGDYHSGDQAGAVAMPR